jgi:hypothetical protein
MCFRGIIGVIVVYSIIDSISFEFAHKFITTDFNKKNLGSDMLKILISNKMELSS